MKIYFNHTIYLYKGRRIVYKEVVKMGYAKSINYAISLIHTYAAEKVAAYPKII